MEKRSFITEAHIRPSGSNQTKVLLQNLSIALPPFPPHQKSTRRSPIRFETPRSGRSVSLDLHFPLISQRPPSREGTADGVSGLTSVENEKFKFQMKSLNEIAEEKQPGNITIAISRPISSASSIFNCDHLSDSNSNQNQQMDQHSSFDDRDCYQDLIASAPSSFSESLIEEFRDVAKSLEETQRQRQQGAQIDIPPPLVRAKSPVLPPKTRSRASSFLESRSSTSLVPISKLHPSRSQLRHDIDTKIERMRTSESERCSFENEIASVKAQRRQRSLDRRSEHDFLLENKKLVPSYFPPVRYAQTMSRLHTHDEHVKEVCENFQLEDSLWAQHKIETLEKKEEHRLFRKRLQKLTVVLMLCSRAFVFGERVEFYRALNLKEKKRVAAALVIQRCARIWLRRHSRTKVSRAFKIIRRALLAWIRRRRTNKRIESAKIVSWFVHDLKNSFFIVMAVKKYRASVVKIQRAWRRHHTMLRSRLLLLSLKWEKFLNSHITKLEESIIVAETARNTTSSGGPRTSGVRQSGGSGNLHLSHHNHQPRQKQQHRHRSKSPKPPISPEKMKIDTEAVNILCAIEEMRRTTHAMRQRILKKYLQRKTLEFLGAKSRYKKLYEEYERLLGLEKLRTMAIHGESHERQLDDYHKRLAEEVISCFSDNEKEDNDMTFLPAPGVNSVAAVVYAAKSKFGTSGRAKTVYNPLDPTRELKPPRKPFMSFLPTDRDMLLMLEEGRALFREEKKKQLEVAEQKHTH